MTETALPRQYELKTAPAAGPVSVDAETGIVEAIVSVTGIVDHGNDVIEPGAYKDTLSQRNPKVCWAHDWKNPVGKVLEAVELMPGDDRLPPIFHKVGAGALYVRTQFNLATQSGRDAFENVKFWGDEGEWSIGYDCSPARGGASKKGNDGARHISKLALFEVSPVLHGMAPLTATLSTKGLAMADMEALDDIEGKVSQAQRDQFAKDGVALPDGSYYIRNASDLANAINDYNRTGQSERVAAHIKKRAAALGLTDKLPDGMKADDEGETKFGQPRDADSDGFVYDGTVRQRPAPPRARSLRSIPTNVGHYQGVDALRLARGFDIDLARSDTAPELPRTGAGDNPRNWTSTTLDQTIVALRDATRLNRGPEDSSRLRTLRELRAARGGLPSNLEITDIAATVRETANNWSPDEIAAMAETQTDLAEQTPTDYRRAYVARTLADLVEETGGDPSALHERLDALPPQPDDRIDIERHNVGLPGDPGGLGYENRRAAVAQHRTGAADRAAAREAARRRGRSRVAKRPIVNRGTHGALIDRYQEAAQRGAKDIPWQERTDLTPEGKAAYAIRDTYNALIDAKAPEAEIEKAWDALTVACNAAWPDEQEDAVEAKDDAEIIGEDIPGVEGVDWEWVEVDADGNEIGEKALDVKGKGKRAIRDGDHDGMVNDGTPLQAPAPRSPNFGKDTALYEARRAARHAGNGPVIPEGNGKPHKPSKYDIERSTPRSSPPSRSEINWYLKGGGDPAWRAQIEALAREHGTEMVHKKGKKKKRKKGKYDIDSYARSTMRASGADSTLGGRFSGRNAKSLTDWEEEDDMEDLVDVSAEDLASAASDALDLYLATEFADEDIAVVGWVEDTYDDHVAVGVGHYDDQGKPAVEFWDLPVSWYDGDNGVFAELGDPVLLDVVGVAPEVGKTMCLSAAEIIRSGIASKSMLQARRRMEMLVDEQEKGLIDAEARYDATDPESKDGAYCDRPSMAARVIKKRAKRKPKEKGDIVETLDAFTGAVTKTALDLLTEVQVFATSGDEATPEAVQEMIKSLGNLIDTTKTVEVKDDDGAVLLDPDVLAYALERGINPFGDEEALEPACADTP